MLTSIKKLFISSSIAVSIFGIVITNQNIIDSTEILANTPTSSLITTLNRNISTTNVLDVFNLTTTINTINSTTAYSSASLVNSTTASSAQSPIGINLNGNANDIASVSFTLNNNIVKYYSIELNIDRETGGNTNPIKITVNYFNAPENPLVPPNEPALITIEQTFTDSTSAFINPRVTAPGIIKTVTISTDITAQNKWFLNEIKMGYSFTFSGDNQASNFVSYSNLLLSYTGDGCTARSNETVATSGQVDEMISIYNSMTDDQKLIFRSNYPNAWGRLQLLARKAAKSI